MWAIFKVLIQFVTILFLVYVFGHEACGILVPQPESETVRLAFEADILTTGPPGKP